MNRLRWMALFELALFVVIIGLDVMIPSLIIIGVGIVFARLRNEKIELFGQNTENRKMYFFVQMIGLGVALTLLDFCIVIPLLNHLTGTTQDMNIFSQLKGNKEMLLILLAYSWVVAAIMEEVAYRGFFQNRIISMFSNRKLGMIIAVITTSVLFGIMHSEQGVVGMVNTALDAVIFSVIRHRYKTVWASVLVHGFSNTIGIIAFYFAGPLYGLW